MSGPFGVATHTATDAFDSAEVRAVVDGLVVVGLCYVLINRHIGALTAHYTVFVFLLLTSTLCALAPLPGQEQTRRVELALRRRQLLWPQPVF